MGCISSSLQHSTKPNHFQRMLCVHHKNIPIKQVYEIISVLGRGAFGVVEQVLHIKTRRKYAMKTVTFGDGNKRSDFEKEIDILRGLHHPNIVRMVETYEGKRY